jgi:LPPG:FO 2-phospho-L-lactate transferase
MMQELGIAPDALSVARRYEDFIDAFVIDRADQAGADLPGVRLVPADTLMLTLTDREALARTVLAVADAMREKAR